MFDIHRSPFADGQREETEAEGEYLEGLMTAFAESPEGQECASEWGRVGWAATLLEYGMSYRGEGSP